MKKILQRPAVQSGIINAKKLWYANRGEPIEYGSHKLRYIPGTRPTRLSYVNSTDEVVRNDVRQIQFLLEQIKPGDFVLDIGGNVGQYAILFASLVDSAGRVITFEPDSNHREVLRRNLELNNFKERVTVEDLALSDQNGTHIFFSRDNDQMCSLVRSGLGTNADLPDVNERLVKTCRLDDYLATHNLDFPNWVKMDTEGAEVNILRGARNLLQSTTTVVCELHPYAWPEFNTSYEELLSIVRECQRSIKYLDDSHRIEDGPLHGAVIIY
jgi:FkbM family methyltransferase